MDSKKALRVGTVKFSTDQIPLLEEVEHKGHIKMGKDDKYAELLLDLARRCPTHGSLCKRIGRLIHADGIQSTSPEGASWLKAVKANATMSRVAQDYKLFGGGYLDIRYSAERNRVIRVHHLPWQHVRATPRGEHDEPLRYIYCENWQKRSAAKECIPLLGHSSPDDDWLGRREILPILRYSAGTEYYAEPDYAQALAYAKLEASIAEFHNANIENGFMPSFQITFVASGLSDDEEDEIVADLEDRVSGRHNAGRWVVHFVDDASQVPTLTPMPSNDADKLYDLLSKECENKLLIAHGVVSPALFGISTAGKLGSVQEMHDAWLIFTADYVDSIQKELLEAIQAIYSQQTTAAPAQFAYQNTNPYATTTPAPAPTLASTQFTSHEQTPTAVHGALAKQGQQAPEGYVEVWSGEAIPDGEELRDRSLQTAGLIFLDVDGKSAEDTSLFLVRYRYAPQTIDQGTKGHPSRDFCRNMVRDSLSGVVFTREAIQVMSSQPLNAGLGPNGTDIYDIWLYKGGARCHHFWERVVYLREDQRKISAAQAQALINRLDPADREAARINRQRSGEETKVAKRPIDMPNEGFINPR